MNKLKCFMSKFDTCSLLYTFHFIRSQISPDAYFILFICNQIFHDGNNKNIEARYLNSYSESLIFHSQV